MSAAKESRLDLLETAAREAREWKARRDRAIIRARASGATYREISEASKLSIGALQGILGKVGP